MNQVVRADREAVAVAGDDPNGQIRIRAFDAHGDGRRAPVNAVNAIGIEVVWEPGRASNSGNKYDFLAGDAEASEGRFAPAKGFRNPRSPGTI